MKAICLNELKKIELEDLRRLQINMLDFVVEFCKQNGINYWLDSGTLLGAIRHKGYIPWDDDIDIGMLRADYDKFQRTFNDENNRFIFKSVEIDKDFNYAFGKVLDTTTILYEPNVDGNKLSVYIDIFVYDNAIDLKDANLRYKKRDWLKFFNDQRNAKLVCTGGMFRKIMVGVFRLFLRIFPRSYFVQKISKNSKKHMNEHTQFVGNFTAHTKMICDKDVFDGFIQAEFEGKFYNIPVGYDKWLRAFYGEYMILPPHEKQTSHHLFEAYYI